MCLFMDRSRVKTKSVSEVESATEKASKGVAEPQPEDASSTDGDGTTFVALLELENEEELDLFRRSVPT
jgi:hypothetical protein